MSWNKLSFAAVLGTIALASPHARAQAPATAPAATPAAVEAGGEHEVTEAERAKLEAESEAATTAPAAVATAVTTQPALPNVPPPHSRSYGSSSINSNGAMVLPSSYYALMSRSIFIKGSQEVSDPFGRGGSYARNNGNDRPASLFPTTQSSISRPETTLIFDGATHADGRFRALIEDTGSHAITPVSPGDRLASGTITALTLDTLDYTVGGRTVHVGVGQNLDGVDAALGGAAAGGSGSSFTTTPSSATPSSGDSSATPAAANDILEKLKKRRQQELTGK